MGDISCVILKREKANTMADFRTHASFGVALGVVSAIGVVTLAFSHEFGFLVAIFLAAALGSVLPDIDSDSGVPFHITFGALSLVVGSLVFLDLSRSGSYSWGMVLFWSVAALAFIWLVVGAVFKRFTKHRGMAHSIPAALLFGLSVFFLATHFSWSDVDSFLLAISGMAGYLVHLILDEVYAAVNFEGKSLGPKRSFGSALKFFSHSKSINIAMYGIIMFLLMGNWDRLLNLALGVWKSFAG